jgi:hypothetical protein
MQGDFSRTTFDPLKHYSAVLAQQGRVQLDADFNEQAAILLRQLRTVVADLVGPARAPADGGGFEIEQITTDEQKPVREDLAISRGRIYVDGILVENDLPGATYWTQPDLRLDPDSDELPPEGAFVVYLRVWERLVTALQDPAIREIALGDPGPDTAARAKTVWQVAALGVAATDVETAAQEFAEKLDGFRPTGLLTAKAKQPPSAAEDACHLPPDNLFRGHENQLYRVEVHTGGPAWWTGTTTTARRSTGEVLPGATFKWSRENASVVFPVVSLAKSVAKLGSLGRDGKLGLEVGDRVELVDDATAGRVADDVAADEYPVAAPRLRTVVAIDAADLQVTLDSQEGDDDCGPGAHPFLRRWDHLPGPGSADVADDGAIPLVEGRWHELEDGVQVYFEGPPAPLESDGDPRSAGTYRRGDYWLIPARTANGDVLWPKNEFRPPNGVEYHYAPLAYVSGDNAVDTTLRKTFVPLADGSAPLRQEPKPKPTTGRRKPTG